VLTSAIVVDESDKTGEGDGENNKLVSHAFDVVHPLKITWDPSVGVDVGAFNAAASLSPMALPLLSLVAVVVAALTRNA